MDIIGFTLLAVFIGLMIIFRTWFPNLHFTQLTFPEAWRDFLKRHVEFYCRLDAEGKKKFERDVQEVMRRKNMEGVKGFEPTERHRLLVAAGIATLFHAMTKHAPAFRRPIIIYPGKGFSEDFKPHKGRIAGMAMPKGPMILAADSIIRGYDHKKDSFNPVLHELAHYLDFDPDTRSVADDAPMGLAPEQLQEWHDVRDMELEKLDRKESPLSDYAMSDTGELFACAVEMFFENPEPLKTKSPELYGLLRDYFQLDPLALYSRGRNKAGAKVQRWKMPCPHCQEEVEWGLEQCPFCSGKLDTSYLLPDKAPSADESLMRKGVPVPNRDQVNWPGVVGVVLVFLGLSALIFTLFSRERFPGVEQAWPSFQLLFGLWALYMRRSAFSFGAFIPLGIGFLFRGLQISLSSEEWSEISFIWPGIFFITGVVWVFVASPEWRKENWKDFWPWPRGKKKDDK